MNVSFVLLTLTEKTKWGEGRSQRNGNGGSRANKLHPKLLGVRVLHRSRFWGGQKSGSVPFLQLKTTTTTTTTDVAVELQHPGLPSGSCRSCGGAVRPSVRGTRGTIAPSFFQIRNRIFALPPARLPARTGRSTRLSALQQFPDTQIVEEELQRGLENVLSFL